MKQNVLHIIAYYLEPLLSNHMPNGIQNAHESFRASDVCLFVSRDGGDGGPSETRKTNAISGECSNCVNSGWSAERYQPSTINHRR